MFRPPTWPPEGLTVHVLNKTRHPHHPFLTEANPVAVGFTSYIDAITHWPEPWRSVAENALNFRRAQGAGHGGYEHNVAAIRAMNPTTRASSTGTAISVPEQAHSEPLAMEQALTRLGIPLGTPVNPVVRFDNPTPREFAGQPSLRFNFVPYQNYFQHGSGFTERPPCTLKGYNCQALAPPNFFSYLIPRGPSDARGFLSHDIRYSLDALDRLQQPPSRVPAPHAPHLYEPPHHGGALVPWSPHAGSGGGGGGGGGGGAAAASAHPAPLALPTPHWLHDRPNVTGVLVPDELMAQYQQFIPAPPAHHAHPHAHSSSSSSSSASAAAAYPHHGGGGGGGGGAAAAAAAHMPASLPHRPPTPHAYTAGHLAPSPDIVFAKGGHINLGDVVELLGPYLKHKAHAVSKNRRQASHASIPL